VGVFGIPFAVVRAGLVPTLITGSIVLVLSFVIHLLLVEIVLNTKGAKQLPGYVGTYLGSLGKLISVISNSFGAVGALLAYLIVGGYFFSLFVAPVFHISPAVATIAYFIVGALIMIRGVNGLPSAHLLIFVLFAFVLVVLGISVGGVMEFTSVPVFGPGLITRFLLPYGVFLFSFWSLSLVPELVQTAGRNRAIIRKALIFAFLTALLSYSVFSLLVVGASGNSISEDAIMGLRESEKVTGGVVGLAALFGVLTTFSSFLAIGHTLKRTFVFDFGIPNIFAWLMAMGLPFLLFIFGVNQFVKVLGVTGAVFLGIDGILVIIAYISLKNSKRSKKQGFFSTGILGLIIAFFLVGIIIEVLRTMNLL